MFITGAIWVSVSLKVGVQLLICTAKYCQLYIYVLFVLLFFFFLETGCELFKFLKNVTQAVLLSMTYKCWVALLRAYQVNSFCPGMSLHYLTWKPWLRPFPPSTGECRHYHLHLGSWDSLPQVTCELSKFPGSGCHPLNINYLASPHVFVVFSSGIFMVIL